MTKREFLEKLKNALGNDLTGSIIQENVDYYDQYISEEVGQGKSEEEVISELGDPWVLAQTIIDTSRNSQNSGNNFTYDPRPGSYEDDNTERGTSASGGWFRMVLILLAIIGVLIVLLIVVGGILRFIAPILLPVLVISMLMRMFKQ